MSIISCPQCSKLVNSQARYCEYCGVDLALAAAIAEQTMMSLDEGSASVPIAPEVLVPRLGAYLLEKGVLQPEALERALQYQKRRGAAGQQMLLGQALLALGLVDRETLDEVVTKQILELQSALNAANRQLEQRVQERTRELQQALERVGELNQLKSNFIANISHELRTPLTHLKGYLDLLGSGGLGSLNAQQSEVVTVLVRAEERLERLIEDLIQFSLASRGELSLSLGPVDVRRVILAIVDQLAPAAEKNGIRLQAEIPAALPAVTADEDKFSWVILQLLDNALKFTPRGGFVQVKAQVDHNLIQFEVADSGIGIPAERIAEIFEPFHQLDGSATRRYAGTGLGLAMVRRIIEAHGTQIGVESTVGQGSIFRFSLPLVSRRSSEGS